MQAPARHRPTSPPPKARPEQGVSQGSSLSIMEAVPPPSSPPPSSGDAHAQLIDELRVAETAQRLRAQVAGLQAELEASQAALEASQARAEAERRGAATARALYKSSTAAHAVATRSASSSSASQIDELQTELSEVEASRQQLADENAAVSLASRRFLDQRSKEALETLEQDHAVAMERASQAAQMPMQALEKRHEQAHGEMAARHTW
jgi:anion-transporting  ArsA/GET3 family ATPase